MFEESNSPLDGYAAMGFDLGYDRRGDSLFNAGEVFYPLYQYRWDLGAAFKTLEYPGGLTKTKFSDNLCESLELHRGSRPGVVQSRRRGQKLSLLKHSWPSFPSRRVFVVVCCLFEKRATTV